MSRSRAASRAVILCSGVVQGIGFRPFVYRIAVKRGLNGYVANLGDAGVRIEVEGRRSDVEEFIKALRTEKPPLAKYESIRVRWLPYTGKLRKFKIVQSDKKSRAGGVSYVPPDIAVCDQCIRELFNPNDRRYLYPFIVCSGCGPRFTVIEDLPYDRERTSMRDFPMCLECDEEYRDPLNRRYHAEPTCCPICGPQVSLYDSKGGLIKVENPIREVAKLVDEGYIVAIKGIGGTHIAVKTTEDEPVLRLRARRRKPGKPFAIMAKNLEAVKSFAIVSMEEEELLLSYRRPIVVLKKSENYYLSEYISPGLHTIGVMLPYSGIHELLMYFTKEPALVMTSGNYPDQPMAITNDQVFKTLSGIIDYFLLHNRRIVNRNDDSVVRVVDGKTAFLRRSRGYVPEPIKIPFLAPEINALAVGPELHVTGAVLKGNHCYLTQHIGNVENLDMINFLESALNFMVKMLRVSNVDVVACDLNPVFHTTRLAEELAKQLKVPVVRVQHHHAHIASLMAECELNPEEEVIGIAVDGVGYGLDGTAWGGEIIKASYTSFNRVGYLTPQPMPGGDLCAKYPARMAAAVLSQFMSTEEAETFAENNLLSGFRHGSREIQILLRQLELKRNLTYTSSAGRILDAVSALLGVCYERTYDGEPAMKLEAYASKGDPKKVRIPIECDELNGAAVLNTTKMVEAVVESLRKDRKKDIAASFQKALATGLAEIAVESAGKIGVGKILMSGGVSYNESIVETVKSIVEANGLKFYRHIKFPPGDGGISLGQCVVSALRFKAGEVDLI